MRQLQMLLVRYLLLFYLSSAYLSAIHIHKNVIQASSDCKVCIIVKNLHGGDSYDISTDNMAWNYGYGAILFSEKEYKKSILKGFFSNAPPCF